MHRPEPQEAVAPGRREERAVRAEGEAFDTLGVPGELRLRSTGRQVPEADATASLAGGDETAGGIDGDGFGIADVDGAADGHDRRVGERGPTGVQQPPAVHRWRSCPSAALGREHHREVRVCIDEPFSGRGQGGAETLVGPLLARPRSPQRDEGDRRGRDRGDGEEGQ